jgi:hypothetical protein
MTPRERRRLVALVRAATSTGAEAVAAWAGRPDDFDLDEIWTRELARLLPAIGCALTDAGHDDPDLPRLRGMQRKTWVEHQLQATALAPWLDVLDRSDVPVWITGGAALARASWAYGDTPGVRWADDTRLLVRHGDAERAHVALVAAGATPRPAARVRRRLRLHAGVPVLLGDRWIELAWQPSPAMRPGSGWWSGGTTVPIGERRVRTLDAVDAAVATCALAASGATGPSLALDLCRFVADPSLDRDAAEEAAARAGVAGVVRTWSVLADRIRDHADDGWVERLVAPTGPSRAGTAWWTTTSRLGTARAVAAGPALLAERWHLEHVHQLPAGFASRVVERVRRRGARS